MNRDELITALEQIRDLVERALKGAAARSGPASKGNFNRKQTSPAPNAGALSFSLNARAFMKKYAKNLSGSQKFTLLAAHMARGKPNHAISSDKLIAEWNRMKSILGGAFNHAHANRAKENGWIDSPKRGSYALSDTWRGVLS